MIIVVDSGSTKSDWVVIDDSTKFYYTTMGLNPFFHNEQTVYTALLENKELFALKEKVVEVYFYGAGCSSKKLNSIIHDGLKLVFKNAEIHVDHDLMACAYATYEGEPAISCILGTGSNSCYFDGERVHEVIPALGYILGDEGSGTYFGKQLISNYLYKRLPENIAQAFYNETSLSKDEIIANIYMKPDANVYLATFMKFIVKHASDPYIKEMIFNGFKHFVEIHVLCYPNSKDLKVHFVGSIAHLFRDELKRACDFHAIVLGKTIQKPIDGLIEYHQNKLIAVKVGDNR